jgi:hypothetical protein
VTRSTSKLPAGRGARGWSRPAERQNSSTAHRPAMPVPTCKSASVPPAASPTVGRDQVVDEDQRCGELGLEQLDDRRVLQAEVRRVAHHPRCSSTRPAMQRPHAGARASLKRRTIWRTSPPRSPATGSCASPSAVRVDDERRLHGAAADVDSADTGPAIAGEIGESRPLRCALRVGHYGAISSVPNVIAWTISSCVVWSRSKMPTLRAQTRSVIRVATAKTSTRSCETMKTAKPLGARP